jgi:FAD synthase
VRWGAWEYTCARAVNVSNISGKGGLNQIAFPTNCLRCRKNEYSGVYIVGLHFLEANKYSADLVSGVAKAQTFVRRPPIAINKVRVIV